MAQSLKKSQVDNRQHCLCYIVYKLSLHKWESQVKNSASIQGWKGAPTQALTHNCAHVCAPFHPSCAVFRYNVSKPTTLPTSIHKWNYGSQLFRKEMTVIAQCSQRVMNYICRIKVLKVHKSKHGQALCNLWCRGLGESHFTGLQTWHYIHNSASLIARKAQVWNNGTEIFYFKKWLCRVLHEIIYLWCTAHKKHVINMHWRKHTEQTWHIRKCLGK